MIEKSLDDYFADWEGHVFGFGYGTGEDFVIPKLRRFFELTQGGTYGTSYDYVDLERELEPATAWLLINRFCHHGVGVIEYGSSPRFGWLTKEGKHLRDFVLSHTADELIALTRRDENYIRCYPDACNCGPEGYEQGRVCNNPFWPRRK